MAEEMFVIENRHKDNKWIAKRLGKTVGQVRYARKKLADVIKACDEPRCSFGIDDHI